MDLAQAQALRNPAPGRLDTAGHGTPPRPACETRTPFHPHTTVHTTVDNADRAVEAPTR
ncbi:hypothetical protein ACFV0L_03575 [Streptosporangium canum]|uniref:hypothetical protein n=1 Tax=Streptosporangium canum TaxID=324952 RepID=UPI0036CD4B4C